MNTSTLPVIIHTYSKRLSILIVALLALVLLPTAPTSAANQTVNSLAFTRDSTTGIVKVTWSLRTASDSAMVVIDASGTGKNVKGYFAPGTQQAYFCFPYSGNVDIFATSYNTSTPPTWASPYSNFSKLDNAWSGGSGTCTSNSSTAYDFNIGFNSNGGSGSMDAISGTAFAVVLPPINFTRSGYTFANWNTNQNGIGGTTYTDSQSVTLSSNLTTTLYAQWTATSQSVTYALNGGSGTTPTQANVATGSSFNTAASTGFSRAGYTFAGWSDGSTTYAANVPYTMGASNVTLTAQWTANTLTVTYNTQGGSAISDSQQLPAATLTIQERQLEQVAHSMVGLQLQVEDQPSHSHTHTAELQTLLCMRSGVELLRSLMTLQVQHREAQLTFLKVTQQVEQH